MGGRSSGSSLTPKPSKEERNIYKKIEKSEKSIRDNNFETLIIFNYDGEEKLRKGGAEHEVAVTRYDMDIMTDRICTHNHPLDGVFSWQDINMLVTTNMAELRAIGKTWLYSLQRIAGRPTQKATQGVEIDDGPETYYVSRFARDFEDAYRAAYTQAGRNWNRESVEFREKHGTFDDYLDYCYYHASRIASGWLKKNAHEYGYKFTTKRKRGVKGDVQWKS